MNTVFGIQSRFKDESGSVLPLTLAVLVSIAVIATGFATAGELVAARIKANTEANSLAVMAAGAALAGADSCHRAATLAAGVLLSCRDSGSEIVLSVRWPSVGPLARRISGQVVGEARVGYGAGPD